MDAMPIPEQIQQQVLVRLRRIEGQARGVQRMVEDGRECSEIIHQLASMRAATHSASVFLLKHYAKECWTRAGKAGSGAEPLDELVELMLQTPD